MNKILGISLVIVILVGMTGIGTTAYSINNEPSSNSFVAGTLTLKTNDLDGVTQTLYATGMSPGATIGPSTITLENIGTADGAALDIVFSYSESDGSPNTVNKSDDEVAAMMEVITLNYGGSDLTGSISDVNSNLYKDVYDLESSNLTGLSGIGAAGTKDFIISVKLRNDIGNDFQADGITITMTFTLKQ